MPAELGLANPADRIAAWDVARDRTLPGWSFTDPAVWSAEKKAIFFRHWQYVCHESALTEPGGLRHHGHLRSGRVPGARP